MTGHNSNTSPTINYRRDVSGHCHHWLLVPLPSPPLPSPPLPSPTLPSPPPACSTHSSSNGQFHCFYFIFRGQLRILLLIKCTSRYTPVFLFE